LCVIGQAAWQSGSLGALCGRGGSGRRGVRRIRGHAARRVVKAARDSEAEFILVAGDTFEDNGVDRVLVPRVADIPHERHPELRCPRQVVRRTTCGITYLVTTQEREDVKTRQLGMRL